MTITVDQARTTLRRIRTAEVLFAVVSLYFASSLPLPAGGGREWFLVVHWYGMVAASLFLAWALRRPTSGAWLGAVGLSAYVLGNAALGWRPFAEAVRGRPGPAVALSLALLAVPVVAQVVVGVACWRSREIMLSTKRGSGAPVA